MKPEEQQKINTELEKISKVFNTKSIMSSSDVEQVLRGVGQVMASFKTSTEETKDEVREALQQITEAISQEHDKVLGEVRNTSEVSKSEATKAIQEAIAEVKELAKEVMEMKPLDGMDADEEKIVEEVLKKIKLPEYKETVLDNREQIVEKINSGDEKALKIEAKQIKDLPNFTREVIREVGGHAGAMETPLKDATTRRLLSKDASGAWLISASGGASAFTSLTDVPSSYTGAGGKVVAVNIGETGLEFISASGVGTVTSVAATVPTGLTISGSPITAAGTLAIGLDTGYVIPLQSTLDGLVPYTGATANVDLGTYDLLTDTITASTVAGLTLSTITNGNITLTPHGTGKVGIGTSSPLAMLDVISDNSVTSNFFVTDSRAYAANVGGQFYFRGKYNSGGSYAYLGQIRGNKESATDGATHSFLSFQTNDGTNATSLVDRMRITSAGYVGIGTTTPGYQLDVQGIARVRPGSDTGNGVILMYSSASNSLFEMKNSSGSTKNFLSTSGVSYLNGGNVGINTTTPSGKLEVAQDITAYPTTGAYGQLELTGSTTPAMRLSMGVRTDVEKGYIQAVKSAAAYKDLLINPLGGNVGVGLSSSPGGALDVNGVLRATNGNIEVYDTTNTARGLTLYRNSISLGGMNTNSSQVSFYAVTGYDLDFWVNSSGLLAMEIKNSTGAVQVNTQIELGHASDTTLSRVSAGVVAIEGVNIVTTSSTDTLTNKTLTAPKFADLGFIADANGNEMLIFDTVASAVNEITLANAATTGTPTISATGSDSNISIQLTPKGTGIVKGELKRFMVRLLANTTDTATGTTIGGDYRISNRAITVKAVGAYVDTAGTTNTTTIDINEAGTTILSTKITIDSTEKSSETAATAPVISDTAIAADAVVTFDIDAISTTPAKGLTVWVDYVFQ